MAATDITEVCVVAHLPNGLDGHQRRQARAHEGPSAREEKEQALMALCMDLGAMEDANSRPALYLPISH